MPLTVPVLRTAMQVLPRIPAPLAYRICEQLGSVAPALPAYPAIYANMRHVWPDVAGTEVAALARGVVVNILKNYYDLLCSHTRDAAALASMFRIEGLANGQQALAHGRGVLVVTLHTGNFSLTLEPVAQALGVEILAVVEQMADPAMHALMNELRRRAQITIAPVDRQITRRILAMLSKGGAVVLAQDRAVASSRVRVRFFGVLAEVPAGAALLALKTGAPLLPVYVAREADNCSRIVIDPPVVPVSMLSRDHAVQYTTQALVRVLEGYIRPDPAQWVLTNRVWQDGESV